MSEPSSDSLVSRLLSPFAQVRPGEATTAVLMFAYSFLAMTGYNMLKPVTREAVHLEPGRRQPALGPVRRRRGHRLHHAGLQPRHRPGAAPLDDSGDAARDGGSAGRLLGALQRPGRRASRRRGVLSVRSHPRHPADQPVLDAGQRRLRRAPGQAAVRADRRRQQPGRRDGRGAHGVARRTATAPTRCCC